jgi:hypothetical protein
MLAPMRRRLVILALLSAASLPAAAQAAPSWRVQQACAMQRYLGSTPAFAANAWARDASQVSLGGGGIALRRREDPALRARFDAAMRSGRAFADRAVAELARRDRISEAEAARRIGADPGPWPAVTAARCDALEKRAAAHAAR